jgi:branched-chain amino acid transport system ATP-binding protein
MTYMLQTEKLSKRYGALRVTDEVSIDIRPGELHAVIGPNGSGKTTLINQLSGELRSDAGRIAFSGNDVTTLGIHQRAQLGLVRSYQITSVFDEFTVLENVALSARSAKRHGFSFWRSLLEDQEAKNLALEALVSVGLESSAELMASELGYGERRQLELAMALAMQPKFLLLDEPMAGMSSQESAAVVTLLQKLKGHFTILLVEHDMSAVFSLADRISVLVYGRLLVTGTPEEIRANPEVRAIYLGDEEVVSP